MIHHPHDRSVRRSSFACTVIPMVLSVSMSFACSAGDVSLGEGLTTRDLVQSSRCSQSSILAEESVFVSNQTELEALAGCEEIEGNLSIAIFEGADLAPLASLRSVSGYLNVGAFPLIQDEAAQAAYDAVFATGFLPSLHGLEALEHVGSIQLNSVLVNDLRELESLRQVDDRIMLYDLRNIISLSGLEAARPSRLDILECLKLETLDGFTFGEQLDGLRLDTLPALANIDAAAGVMVVNGPLGINGTRLRALPELALVGAHEISISGNPELVDASGLRTLIFTERLRIVGNPLLKEFPALPDLNHVDQLDVIGNGITTLALNFPGLERRPQTVGHRTIELPADPVVIASNPNLSHLSVPAIYPRVRNFLIYDHATLQEIDFGSLQRADLLVVEQNAVLDSVTLGSLTAVASLEVTNNPTLVPDVFDSVRTLDRSSTGNAVP